MHGTRDRPLSPSDRPLSPRQETFRHSYVYYPNAANAAREAGYGAASVRQQGHRLPRTPCVAARVAAIRRTMAEDGCRETGVLLGKLENVHNRAIEDRHYVAAARTVEIPGAARRPHAPRSTSAGATPGHLHPPVVANRRDDDK